MSPERVRLPARPAEARLVAQGADAVRSEIQARLREEGERADGAAAAARLDDAVAQLAARTEEACAQLARAATELGLEIARTLLRTEIAHDRYDMEKIVREALAQAAVGRAACVVHLNPADLGRLADVNFRSGTRLEPDAGVPRGDVHVETALGLLVRDLDGALDAIAERLREEHA